MTRSDSSDVPDYPALLRLDDRGFVVVGAGQGIGRQACHALAASGARVFAVDVDAGLATDVAGEVGGIAWSGDATRREDAEALFEAAASSLGSIDGIVDIVGMARYAALTDLVDEDWDWQFDIVLRHAYLAVQLGGRAMADGRGGVTGGGRGGVTGGGRGGVMVFVASVSGITSAPRHAGYGAAKAALMSLVRSAAVELGPSGVRVNAVAPGVVWTPRVSALLGEDGRASNVENTPLGRVALPADIAAAILFLCSDLSSYVNGHTLVVDGGVGAKFPYPMAHIP